MVTKNRTLVEKNQNRKHLHADAVVSTHNLSQGPLVRKLQLSQPAVPVLTGYTNGQGRLNLLSLKLWQGACRQPS